MPEIDTDPILVVVHDGHYDCFSLKSVATPRDLYLMGLLRGKGGINESVAPGRYYFNAAEISENQIQLFLDPAPE